ncbi:MAG: ATP-binding protein [Bacilli bacterium]|jgi:signal transduction histidine kinase|nr:ATP-binding protein [Bacilli bacterium]
MNETLKIKPYARLITMLGDQLIKDESVALSELIKNSYDADASCVIVSFIGFSDEMKPLDGARIEISDNGSGMTENVIKDSWLNPATPGKYNLILSGKDHTPSGRIIQGEKGIGRFSIFKLGKTIKMVTTPQKFLGGNPVDEAIGPRFIVDYDFSMFDDSFSDSSGKNLYLDELGVSFSSSEDLSCIYPKSKPYGTKLIISNLRGTWGNDKIKKVQKSIARMLPIFEDGDENNKKRDDSVSSIDFPSTEEKQNKSFDVKILKNGEPFLSENDQKARLINLLHSDKPAIKISKGHFNSDTLTYTYEENGSPKAIVLAQGTRLSALKEGRDILSNGSVSCGPFDFEFYIFDPAASIDDEPEHRLEKDEYDIIKEHRIYLYRDGIRVMPYGDPEDDWLGIDMLRGVEKASSFMSNDQTVGCIRISRTENPFLQDKTSREGLIENGRATTDFVAAIRLFLRWIRSDSYMTYIQTKDRKKEENRLASETTLKVIADAKEKFKNFPEIIPALDKIAASYSSDKSEYERRLEVTDRLAGVGMSIETTSHDVNLFLGRAADGVDILISGASAGSKLSEEELLAKLIAVRGDLSFAQKQMDNIGILYPGTRAKPKNVNVWAIAEKIRQIYAFQFNKNNISCDIQMPSSPLIVNTVDAVLLQTFINLFDNSLFWLKTCAVGEKKVSISVDSESKKVIFSDNGPGIPDSDIGFVFKPFFSRKGDDGKGLGLYIAKQLLERYGFSIGLITAQEDKILPGANFQIDFASARR